MTQLHRHPSAAVPAEDAAGALPDIASTVPATGTGALAWVGMDAIDLPIRLPEGTRDVRVPARVSVAVDLVAGASRGIHMSRLYLALDDALSREPVSPSLLASLLRECLDSHAGLSTRARVTLAFDHFLRRPALASAHSGWRRYPVEVTAVLAREGLTLDVAFDVVYSSTCPASTALARQLVAEDFARAFPDGAQVDREAALRWIEGENGMRATPHSQRSTASVRVSLDPRVTEWPLDALIDRAETVLGTAVQTAVKRIDEQAFARRNGENPMFCEDAAHRLQDMLASDPRVRGFSVRVAHHESLHAHDAIAVAGSEPHPR